jgi:hypothetical protein
MPCEALLPISRRHGAHGYRDIPCGRRSKAIRGGKHLCGIHVRAALAAPAAAPDTSPATLEAWEKRLEREAEVNDPNESEP